MLKVGDIVLSFFQLVLGIFFKLAPNAIDKGLEVSRIFLEESLKL